MASVIGTLLTVWFSWSAKSAAKKALDAANAARTRMQVVDWLMEFRDIIHVVEEVRASLEADLDWIALSKNFSRLRVSAAVFAKRYKSDNLDLGNRLKISASQFASLADAADKHAEGKGKSSVSSLKKVMASQMELYTLLLNEAKQAAGGGKNGN